MSRLWDKGAPIDEMVLAFTVGQDHLLDARLVAFDVVASQAHARMLARQGYLEPGQAQSLCEVLQTIADEHARGEWKIEIQDEDCHTALENRLVERLGEVGKRIHLGRSRNDQVLTALRLYLRSALSELESASFRLADRLEQLAVDGANLPMPGYTHLQRAMPSSVELWATAYAAEIRASAGSLQAARTFIATCPMGSAAGFGTPGITLDRAWLANELGFESPHDPVTAVQLSRGKAEAATAFACTLIQQDIGRLASDLCLFASAEFGFVRLSPEFTTGSSIMPQKRNPDVFELVRARSAQAPSDLTAILALTSKMTSGYHRDLQLIKEPLFRTIDQTLALSEVMVSALEGVSFDLPALKRAMTSELDATERANRLVAEQGLSFRDAYQQVASEF